MAEILSPFNASAESVKARIRSQRDVSRNRKPLPKAGTEGSKVTKRLSSPVAAAYKRLGVRDKDLQV